MLTVDLSNIWLDANVTHIFPYQGRAEAAHERLLELDASGRAPTGWLNWPKTLSSLDMGEISAAAQTIRDSSRSVVIIGAGGSYLGSRSVIELLYSGHYNELGLGPRLYFAGHDLSTRELDTISSLIGDEDFSVIVISKSGTTLEPALALRYFRSLLWAKYGESGANARITAVTDKGSGLLYKMAKELGWRSFYIPGNIGGRYSVFTPAGLLPMAVAGVSLQTLILGARQQAEALARPGMDNPAWQYAMARNLLYDRGKGLELLACFEPAFECLARWWQQLFGESEGKDGKGLFPASVSYTADLHSLGQYIQQGERTMFETFVRFEHSGAPARIPGGLTGSDGLDHLAGRELQSVQSAAINAVVAAHTTGGVPCILIESGSISERSVGGLMYFFQLACALSALMLGVDPFNQPGVEEYKSNIKRML